MNQMTRQLSLWDMPEAESAKAQKETAAPDSSVGADEGQPQALNMDSIPQDPGFVTGFTEIFRGPANPVALLFDLPRELADAGLFCGWKYEERGGKRTKVPYELRTGQRARSNDPACFLHLTDIVRTYDCDGLGLGIFGGIGAIDIDGCVLEDGTLTDTAAEVVRIMHSYTEYSPSGKGLHILFKAPGFAYDVNRYYIMNHPAGIEVYVAGATSKYVTVTGNAFGGPADFGDRSAELAEVLEKYMRRNEPAVMPFPQNAAGNAINAGNPACGSVPDDQLLRLAMNSKSGDAFRRLWSGDISGYPSPSEADAALCSRLAFWTAKDAAQMDRLFRRSGLMRDKWDRRQSGSTYGAITIAHALAQCSECYTPRTEPPKPIPLTVAPTVTFQPLVPLKPAQEQLPPFPTEALPKAIADYAQAVAANTQTAPDMAGVTALGVLAIALQGKYEVQVNGSWTEQLSLLTTTIAPPGERKSPVLKLMTRCIEEYERQYNEKLAPEIRNRRLDREADERRIAGLSKELEHDPDPEKEEELRRLKTGLEEEPELIPARFTADDCTSEALTALMAKHHGRIGVISAEGGIFDILAGRYNNRVNLDIWLKGWCGDMVKVDRLGREPQYIPNPCLSACFAIQPSVLAEIMDNTIMNGRGLVARFLFSSPPSRIGTRTFFAPAIPQEVTKRYTDLIFRLMDLELAEKPKALLLSTEASEIIARHFEENEQFLNGRGQVIAEWGNKYIGTILRIAGLMSITEGETEFISGEIMSRAIALGRYFQAHTWYAYAMIGSDISQQKAAFVLAQLKEKRITEIKRQELFQMCRGRYFKKTEDIFPTLALLEEHGYIAQVQPERTGAGRPPDVKLHVNPKAFSEEKRDMAGAEPIKIAAG